MTLNIGEASAVNTVIGHLIGRPRGDREIVTREQAIDALALLARGARKALSAGDDQTQAHEVLTEHWPATDSAAELEKQVADANATTSAVYHERAHLVALLAALYPSTWAPDPAEGDWPVVYIKTPAGQLSWHINPTDWPLFAHVPHAATEWDGHTTDEKYQRVRHLTEQIAAIDISAAAERVRAFLDERATRAGRPHNNPLITSWHGVQLLEADLRALLAEHDQTPATQDDQR